VSTKRFLKHYLNQRKQCLSLSTRKVIENGRVLLLREVYIIRGSYAIGREPAAGLRCAAIDRGFLNHFWTWMQIMKEGKKKFSDANSWLSLNQTVPLPKECFYCTEVEFRR